MKFGILVQNGTLNRPSFPVAQFSVALFSYPLIFRCRFFPLPFFSCLFYRCRYYLLLPQPLKIITQHHIDIQAK